MKDSFLKECDHSTSRKYIKIILELMKVNYILMKIFRWQRRQYYLFIVQILFSTQTIFSIKYFQISYLKMFSIKKISSGSSPLSRTLMYRQKKRSLKPITSFLPPDLSWLNVPFNPFFKLLRYKYLLINSTIYISYRAFSVRRAVLFQPFNIVPPTRQY